jgi:hypothetical protein
MYLKVLEKKRQEQNNPKISIGKEIINTMVEINED